MLRMWTREVEELKERPQLIVAWEVLRLHFKARGKDNLKNEATLKVWTDLGCSEKTQHVDKEGALEIWSCQRKKG